MVLAPHLDKSLLPEELNLIYMEAGVFPEEEELKGIIRMHGLLEPSRKLFRVFLQKRSNADYALEDKNQKKGFRNHIRLEVYLGRFD